MSAVYDSDLTDIYDVSVMLALANHADDDGVCYPSIARICKLSRCKERKAQNVIKSLQERGYLDISLQAGPRGTNLYVVSPDPRTTCTPAPHAPPHATTEPPHVATDTPAQCAPETSITIIEPSVKSKAAKKTDPALRILCEVNGVTEQAAASFIKYRKGHKSKFLSETAASRLAASLWEIRSSGGDPSDALGMAEERGWATMKPDWYASEMKKQNNSTQGSRNNDRTDFDTNHREYAKLIGSGQIQRGPDPSDPFAGG